MAESSSTEGFLEEMFGGSDGEGERESDQLIFFVESEGPRSKVGGSELESESRLELQVLGLRIDLGLGGVDGTAGANVGGLGKGRVGSSMVTV